MSIDQGSWECVTTAAGAARTAMDVDWSAASGQAGPIAHSTEQSNIDGLDWWFRTRTDAAHLRIDGLSFPAQIFIDGVEVASARSSFLPVEIDLPGRDCEIAIACRSLDAWLETKRPRGRWRSSMTGVQGMRWARVSLLGRVQAYAGAPPPVGAVGVRLGDGPPIRNLRVSTRFAPPDASVDPAFGEVRVTADADAAEGLVLVLRDSAGIVARQAIAPTGDIDVRIPVEQPKLWWPNGYGEPACYELAIEAAGREVARRTIGFRNLEVDRSDGGFAVAVNGVSVFARGATVLDGGDAALVDAYADAGATMLRFAGGTLPATAETWERCARRGVLVWHDCMLATFDLPNELYELVADELRALLVSHGSNPSLAVICGGSETEQQPELMGLDRQRRAQPLLHQVLPDVIDEWLDVPNAPPDLAYVSSSPCAGSGDSAIRPDDGIAHWFGVGGYRQPLGAVRSAGVRFAGECLAFAVPPDGVDPASIDAESWRRGVPKDRGAGWDFEDVRDHYAAELFGADMPAVRRTDPARYLELGRAAVSEAMTECFARWRRPDDPCAGALVLSTRDLQPGAGWGLLDHAAASKAPLRALRRVWSPVALTLLDDGLSGLRIDIYNDSVRDLEATIELRATNDRGQLTVEGSCAVRVGERSSLCLYDSDVTGRFSDLMHAYRFGDPVASAIDVRLIGRTGELLARESLVVQPATAPYDGGLSAVREGDRVRLISEHALRWVRLDLPDADPCDDGFHLASGIEYAVALRPAENRPRSQIAVVRSIDLASPVVLGGGGSAL